MDGGNPADRGFPTPPFPTDAIVTTPISASQWRTLSQGVRSPLVIVVQQQLKSLYPELSITGKFGAQTRAAVRNFQMGAGLPVTGRVDVATASALGVLVRAALPTFPPAGWRWNGWSYSGSAAVAAWEQRLTNGPLRLDPIAAGLFEGFLADLRRGSFRIDESDTYTFRCTAQTTKNCKGLGIASLSYHAWGLAVDINYSSNPLQDVTHEEDACAAGAEHTMPDWVLKTALHWGLFWGGWYSCPDPNETSVVKDPHHFEFRGTPELARAIIAKNTRKGARRASVPGIASLYLNCGDSGAAVTRLRRLLPRSYRPREAASQSSTFTPALAAALARWQTDRGLDPTGALDPATAAALKIKVRHTERFPVLHLHSCGGAVQALQRALGLPATGTFDARTLNALRAWQTVQGLGPTGVTDTATASGLGLDLSIEAQSDGFDPDAAARVVKPMRVSSVAGGAQSPGRHRFTHR
jgi:peptidoglycan hydrolase-like protein with peptidoglycan-binding domain